MRLALGGFRSRGGMPRKGEMPKKADKQRVPATPRKRRGPGRPFEKGKSGNPAGRPPIGKSLAEAFRAVGEEQVTRGKNKGKTRLDVLIRSLYKQATAGSPKAATLIADRGWGKALQPISGDDGGPITIRIIEG